VRSTQRSISEADDTTKDNKERQPGKGTRKDDKARPRKAKTTNIVARHEERAWCDPAAVPWGHATNQKNTRHTAIATTITSQQGAGADGAGGQVSAAAQRRRYADLE